jgi:hypothetical protein
VAIVFKAMPLRASRREREDRLEAVKRLNRALLVEGKHGGVPRRIQVEANDIGGLRLEVWIGRRHVPSKPVRLQARSGPDARHHHVTDPHHPGQFAGAPMGGPIGRDLTRAGQNPRFHLRRQDPRWLAPIPRPQPDYAPLDKPAFPPADVGGEAAHGLLNRRVGLAGGHHQDHLRPPNLFGPCPARSGATQQLSAVLIRQQDRRNGLHAPQYTTTISIVTVH